MDMKPTRRSSRTSKRNAEKDNSAAGPSRDASCEKQQKRKRRCTNSEQELEPKRSNVTIVDPVPNQVQIEKKVDGGRFVDPFCWICHNLVEEDCLICDLCPRAYHKDCLIKKKVQSLESSFCQCNQTTVDGSIPAFTWTPPELAEMLKYAMKEAVTEEKRSHHKSQKAENDKFHKFFKTWPSLDENKILVNIIDIDILIDKIHLTPPYQNTGHFFFDVKWIYHNCCIVYGADHEITETALKLEKKIKQELLDIEACRECYKNKHTMDAAVSNYFTRVCQTPHKIVWAKLRGSPYWPAKCLKINNIHADVRFFGTHDKSCISINQIYKISKIHPEGKNINKMAKLKEATNELMVYISNYEMIQGRSFEFYDKRVPINEPHSGSKKKHHKKAKLVRNHAENPKPQENSCVDMKPKIIPIKMKEMNPKLLIPKLKEPFETKVEALHKSDDFDKKFCRRDCRDDSDAIEDASTAGTSGEIHYHLTFTTDDTTPTVVNTDSFVHNSMPQCSISDNLPENLSSFNEISHDHPENTPKNEIALSSIASSDVCSETALLQPCTDIPQVKLDNFTNNVNQSVQFPVITSAQSAVEFENNAIPVSVLHENSPIISETFENFPTESETFENCTVVSESVGASASPLESGLSAEGLAAGDDPDSDDDIQVVTEKSNNPLSEYVLGNSSVSRIFCELFANSPAVKDNFQMLQTASQEFFLRTLFQLTSHTMRHDELVVYKKFLCKYEQIRLENINFASEVKILKEKNASLEIQIKSLLDQKNQKDALRDEIIKASALKLHNSETDLREKIKESQEKILELQEQVKALKESNKELKNKETTEDNKELKEENEYLKIKNMQLEEKYLSTEKKMGELNVYLETLRDVEKKYKKLECETNELKKKLKQEVNTSDTLSNQLKYYENKLKKNTKVKQKKITDKCVHVNKSLVLGDMSEKSTSVMEETLTLSTCGTNNESLLNNSHSVVIKCDTVSAMSSPCGTLVCEESVEHEYVPASQVQQLSLVQVPYVSLPLIQPLNSTITSSDLNTCFIPNVSANSEMNLSLQPGTSRSNLYQQEISCESYSSSYAVQSSTITSPNPNSGLRKSSRAFAKLGLHKPKKGGGSAN